MNKLKTCEIGSLVLVTLNKTNCFNSRDGMREVMLGGLEKGLLSETQKEKGLISVKSIVGYYVGDRPGLIKIIPLYGIQHFESEYLIINEEQIEDISYLAKSEEPAIKYKGYVSIHNGPL
ncbi:MAG: hypothetical protein WC376_02170 [Candidatus Nanoarchaeia archaeon]|jgi:hypothetical protein